MTSKSGYLGPLSPEYALLGLLAQQPDHGYELHQRLTAALGQVWHVSQSQVYNILKRLEARGDLRGEVQLQGRGPSRLLYELTPAGRARFEAWLQAPTRPSVRAIRVEFITRLYFAGQRSPQAAEALIDAQAQEIARGLARLQRTLGELPPEQTFNRLGVELRINQLTSISAWLERCRSALRQPQAAARMESK